MPGSSGDRLPGRGLARRFPSETRLPQVQKQLRDELLLC